MSSDSLRRGVVVLLMGGGEQLYRVTHTYTAMQLSSVKLPCCVFPGVHGREGREEAFSHSKRLTTSRGGGGKTATAVAVVGGGASVEWLVVVGWSVGTGAHRREGSRVVHRARRLSGVREIPSYSANLKDSRKIV